MDKSKLMDIQDLICLRDDVDRGYAVTSAEGYALLADRDEWRAECLRLMRDKCESLLAFDPAHVARGMFPDFAAELYPRALDSHEDSD